MRARQQSVQCALAVCCCLFAMIGARTLQTENILEIIEEEIVENMGSAPTVSVPPPNTLLHSIEQTVIETLEANVTPSTGEVIAAESSEIFQAG